MQDGRECAMTERKSFEGRREIWKERTRVMSSDVGE